MAVKKYKIVCHGDFQETENEVNDLLEQYWVLHGDLKVIGGAENTYAQAMVQEEHYGGIDSNVLVTIEELDGIRFAIESIGESLETVAKAVGYAAPATTVEPPPKPTPARKPAKAKRKPSRK